MNCIECTARLHDYVGGELESGPAHAVEAHLARCAECRSREGALRALLSRTAALPREIDPSRDLWTEIEAGIQASEPAVDDSAPPTSDAIPRRATGARFQENVLRWVAPLAVAASIAALLAVTQRGSVSRRPDAFWSVAALAGAPQLDSTAFEQEAQFRIGQWLETDAASRAKVAVGSIGEVTVDPNSRLRLVGTAATDHRLELARGTLKAFIWAPPRLFFVDTPSATAVDLGCAYTLTVADDGDGELKVTTGYVALEHDHRESIIPMGMMCLTRRGAGPGTPFAVDAPDELRRALARFDFDSGSADALQDVLARARAETTDAITLWHLLARTDGALRAHVFDRLAQLTPPPAGVTRRGILAGDTAMRRAWGSDLGLIH